MAKENPEQRETPELKSSKVVKYIGPADTRIIKHPDWDAVNVADQDDIVWQKSNGWSVPVDLLNDAALDYVDNRDPDFIIADVEVPRER